ncbi:hypothetical protein [Streptomyces sp. BH055]|uniref:hypothetical protein n=1 Tax=unclassified Streptomyces TaxID=2593676 RepID=UPI003BB4A5B9
MTRTTRTPAIAKHLQEGGFNWLDVRWDEQRDTDPDAVGEKRFATRQDHDQDGTYVVVVGAYGPDWLATLGKMRGHLEYPHGKCFVDYDAPCTADHEVMVRWATSAELQAAKSAHKQRQAPLIEQRRQREAEEKAAAARQALEDAGQSGLF